MIEYSNPIWYGRKWRIYTETCAPYALSFLHDDYDGAEDCIDNRHGYGNSLAECIEAIKEIEEN